MVPVFYLNADPSWISLFTSSCAAPSSWVPYSTGTVASDFVQNCYSSPSSVILVMTGYHCIVSSSHILAQSEFERRWTVTVSLKGCCAIVNRTLTDSQDSCLAIDSRPFLVVRLKLVLLSLSLMPIHTRVRLPRKVPILLWTRRTSHNFRKSMLMMKQYSFFCPYVPTTIIMVMGLVKNNNH